MFCMSTHFTLDGPSYCTVLSILDTCMRITVIPCVNVWVCMSVCVRVCHHASCYIPRLYIENKMPLNFLWHFLYIYCMCGFFQKHFVQKIWWHLLITLAFFTSWEILMDKTDNDGFCSRWLACRSYDRSYNSTDTSLVIVNCQLSTTFLALNFLWVYSAIHVVCSNTIIHNWHSCGRSYYTII